jgi:hypothetical protein
MPTYTHTIESLETDGAGCGRWAAEPNYTGIVTGGYNGTARQYARRMLNRYLADVASDAGLPVGAPGSEPCCPTRILVWEKGATGMAAVELRAGVIPVSAGRGNAADS